jgi:hypothetical protein
VRFSEEDFYQGKVNVGALAATIPNDPRFLKEGCTSSTATGCGFQNARAIRLGAKFSF